MFISKKQLFLLGFSLALSLLLYAHTSPSQFAPPAQRLLLSDYTTSSSRTASANTYCSGLSRTSLLNSELSSMYGMFSAQMNSMISLDGNTFIANLLAGNSAAAQQQAKDSAVQVALFIGPFLLGFLALLISAPFLCCCCACPDSCPSRCCRKNQDEQYTNCQLYWPTTVLILGLLLAIGASIAGFSQSEMIPTAVSSSSCASALVLDDIINGNVTADGSSFFLGLTQLDSQLNYLEGNLTTINNTMVNLRPASANMTSITNDANTALSDTAKVPNNVNAGGNMNPITYATPLNSNSPTSTTSSTFPNILGSSSTGGYVGTLYTTTSAALSAINNISSAADNFVTETTNFQSGVSALRTSVQSFKSSAVDMDSSLNSRLSDISSGQSKVRAGIKALYGTTIGLSTIMLISALLVAFCDKIKCRYLMYISCFILFILGVTGFMLTLVSSVAAPAIFFSCQFLDYSLSSSAHFQSNFANLITNATTRTYLSTCLSSSSGDILGALGGTAVSAVGNLSSSLALIKSLNITYLAASVSTALTSMDTAISNYQLGVLNDLSDSASQTILQGLSNHSNYASCATAAFSSDSWIPSVQQNPIYLQCQVSGANATSSQCGGANWAAASGGCSGCMDTTSILNTATYNTRANVLNALNNRYSNAGCSTFNNELANAWNNYYLPKSNGLASVATRAATATTSTNQFISKLTGTLNVTLTNAVNTLSSTTDSVTDPKYGLVAGLNCRLIGEDLSTFTDSLCKGSFTVAYFSRLALGCASFGILFSMWCGVCTGVRFYKHGIRKLNSVENAGLSEEEVEDVTNTNFVKPKILE